MTNEKSESKVFELLSRAEKGGDLTVRDDQNDFPALLDSARLCREKGGRFRLIDTGKLSVFELEWLGQAGSDIYTSDDARPDKTEIELLARACSRGQAIVALFHQGIKINKGFGQSGAYLHLSNREREHSFSDLGELAYACRRTGAWLVYYHYGRPVAGLEDLARNSGWIHVSDQSLESGEDAILLLDVIKEASAAGAGLVLHVEEGLELDVLRDILHAGAFVLFKIPAIDYTSPLRSLEQQTQRHKLDFRAYYLYITILP